MNRCQRGVLINFGIAWIIFTAMFIVAALFAAATVVLLVGVVLAYGLFMGAIAWHFGRAWERCKR